MYPILLEMCESSALIVPANFNPYGNTYFSVYLSAFLAA